MRCGSHTVFNLGTTARCSPLVSESVSARPPSPELGPGRSSIAEDFDKRNLEVAAEIAKARREENNRVEKEKNGEGARGLGCGRGRGSGRGRI